MLIIIELKKYNVKVKIFSLQEQINKYREALLKCLKQKFPDNCHNIEIICILGSPPTGLSEGEKIDETLKAINARYITYDQLIDDTLQGYSDYIQKDKEIKKIQDIIDSL